MSWLAVVLSWKQFKTMPVFSKITLETMLDRKRKTFFLILKLLLYIILLKPHWLCVGEVCKKFFSLVACTFSQESRKRGKKSSALSSDRGALHGFCASPLQDQMHTFVESEFKMGSLNLKNICISIIEKRSEN